MATKERSDNNLTKEWKLETWKTLKAWQKSGKKAANEEALMKNGRNFIKLFHDHEVLSDEDVESFAAFLLDQKAEPATRKIWDKTFFKYVDFWGFKSYLLKNNMQKVTGFQKLPDETVSRMLVSWKTVLQISGPIHEESSLVKLWMAFSEVMVNNTLPQNPRDTWGEGLLKIWPHFSWNIRDKIHKNNLMKLSVQPGFLTIHRKLRVIILWCSGRARNDNHHKWKVIDYTQTFGAALDTVLGLEGDEITDIIARDLIFIATFMIGHLSNFTNLSIDEFPKLSKPVEKDNFILVAPSLAKNIIRIICMMTSRYENVDKTLQTSAAELISLKNSMREMVAAFLLRLGECDLEAVTSLSRLGEFIADQGTQEHVWIVRQMIKHVPGAIMRHRVVSDDAKEGVTSIAGKLLKIMIKRSQVEEANELAIVILGGANHLAALEEVVAILEEENERPASKAAKTKSSMKELTLMSVWNAAANVFWRRVSAGEGISSDPNKLDTTTVRNFLYFPLQIKMMEDDVKNSAELKAAVNTLKRSWKDLYVAVRSTATLVEGFDSDEFNVEIGTIISERGLKNCGNGISLVYLMNMLNASECNKTNFDYTDADDGVKEGCEWTKFSQLVISILEEVAGQAPGQITCRVTFVALSIIIKMIQYHGEKAVMVLGNIITEFATVALANKKDLMWANTVDNVVNVVDAIADTEMSAAKTFPGLEPVFSLLLSKKSVQRASKAVGCCWEKRFLPDHDKLELSPNFWRFIKVHYKSAGWDEPAQKKSDSTSASVAVNESETAQSVLPGVSSLISETERVAPASPKVSGRSQTSSGTPQRGGMGTPQRRNGTPQRNATPQRFSRQLAALQGEAQGSPKTPPRRGHRATSQAGLMSSTVRDNAAPAAEFTVIDSPIHFNKKNLTAAQREKIREKKQEEQVGTSLYSHIDESQSRMSLGADSNTQASDAVKQRNAHLPARKSSVEIEHMDETAMDGTSFLSLNPSAHSTVIVSEKAHPEENTNAPMSVIAEASTLSDETVAEITNSKNVQKSAINELPSDESINMTCDMTAGVGVQCLPDSTVEETMESSALENKTMNMTTGVGCQGTYIESEDESAMEESAVVMDKLPTPKIPSRSSERNDLTMDVTTGIGCQGTFIDSDDESMMEATTEVTAAAGATEPVSSEVEPVSSEPVGCSTVIQPISTENGTDSQQGKNKPAVEKSANLEKQNSLEKATIEETEPPSEEMSLDETLDKSAPFAAEETVSAEPSTSEPSTEQINEKSTVAPNSPEKPSSEKLADPEVTLEQSVKSLPKPKKAEVSLPRPVTDYIPRLNDSECMIIEQEPSTNEEPSTLDEGSLTPDSFVDLTTPEKKPVSTKKTAAARKLEMPKPIEEPAAEPIEPVSGEHEENAASSEKEAEEEPPKMTRTDQFGFEVPYLRNDPDRPKSEMEKIMDADDPELIIPKSDDEEETEAEKQNKLLFSPEQIKRDEEAQKNKLLNSGERVRPKSGLFGKEASRPIIKRKRSSGGGSDSKNKKHRVSFMDDAFRSQAPPVRRTSSSSSIAGNSPAPVRRRSSRDNLGTQSPRNEKSMTRGERILRMANPEAKVPKSPVQPVAQNHSAQQPSADQSFNAIKTAIAQNIENVTDDMRFRLINEIAKRRSVN